MNALIIGCGRVGSSIALQLQREGWDVTVVDENEDALARLGEHWPGAFLVGQRLRALAGGDDDLPARLDVDAGADEQLRVLLVPWISHDDPTSSRTPWGNATMSTSAGDLRRT